MKKLDPTLRAIADTIKTKVTLGEAGEAVFADDVIEATLPEGLSLEQLNLGVGHINNLMAGASLALGELGNDAFKANSSLENVHFKLEAAKGCTLEAVYTKSRENPNPQDPKGPKIISYGNLQPKIVLDSTLRTGQVGIIRRGLSEQAKELFGS